MYQMEVSLSWSFSKKGWDVFDGWNQILLQADRWWRRIASPLEGIFTFSVYFPNLEVSSSRVNWFWICTWASLIQALPVGGNCRCEEQWPSSAAGLLWIKICRILQQIIRTLRWRLSISNPWLWCDITTTYKQIWRREKWGEIKITFHGYNRL